eukprot:1156584-Pelagomonas_calceolata.AAC.4
MQQKTRLSLLQTRQGAHLHVQHVPAQALIALQHILSEGDLGVAVDGDLVVIIQHDELAQTPVAGQGGGLVGQALHHAAITSNAVAASTQNYRITLNHVEHSDPE